MNSVFLMKLRDRQIDEATITTGFKNRIAEELKVPLQVVVEHLCCPTEIPPGVYFKSHEKKPQARAKQSFAEAVQSSGLTPEHQAYLL